jgi:UDP-N-acetylglucosamine 2-epimerase (non-hydrolysing)
MAGHAPHGSAGTAASPGIGSAARAGPARTVLVVIGTRPEGIKLAPVIAGLRERSEVSVRVALTGQHTDLLDQALRIFDIPVDHDLGIMREGQDLYDVATGCLDGLRNVFAADRPDMVLVQGDTATVLFGALVAFFERTRVGHVEAGLRSADKWRPYPEEVFRRLAGVLADLHFAPTPAARTNLIAEGVPPERVFLTGNTVVDALRGVAADVRDTAPANPQLAAAIASGRRLVLVTAHRRESFGAPLERIFMALRDLAAVHPDVEFVYPVHPNPNVRGPAHNLLGDQPGVRLTDPLDYPDLVRALAAAHLVLTDSGGIQEEAPTFAVPVLVLREVTERPEGVTAGVAELVGADRRLIVERASALLAAARARSGHARPNPYGDGRAGQRIADIVVAALAGTPRSTTDWPGA